jgi:hypothetical protein
MPDAAHIVFLLVIAFWTPQVTKPVEVQAQVFDGPEACGAAAERLDEEWIKKVHGGSTSYACIAAFQAPSL